MPKKGISFFQFWLSLGIFGILMNNLLPYSCLTGLLLTVILVIYNKGYKRANLYLAGFFLFTTLFVLSQYGALYGNSLTLAALVASSITPFVFLIGPLSYLYIRGLLKDNTTLSKSEYLHFVPFILQFAGMIPYYFSTWTYKLSVAAVILGENWRITNLNLNSLFPSPINSYLRPLHLLTYLGAQWIMIISFYKPWKNNRTLSHQYMIIRRWVFFFTALYSVFLISYGILSFLLFKYQLRSSFQDHSQIFLLLGSSAILVLNMACFLFPNILYGSPRIRLEGTELLSAESKLPSLHGFANTGVPDTVQSVDNRKNEVILRIEEKLTAYMENNKPWTNKKFSISSLSEDMNIPEHHLRYYFNHNLKITFSTYRNRLRVEHAKNLLSMGAIENLSIEGIGATVGFASKSSFFSVFKELTGQTPGEFLNQHSKNS